MIKIQLRIRNSDRKARPDVSVVLHCTLKNGEAFATEPQQSNKSGIVWFEFSNVFARRIDIPTIRLALTKNGESVKHRMTSPKKVNSGAFRIDVTVEDVKTERSQSEISSSDDVPKVGRLIGLLMDEKRQPVPGVRVDFIENGKVFHTTNSNARGEAVLEVTPLQFESIQWPALQTAITQGQMVYDILSMTPPKPVAALTLQTTIQVRPRKAQSGEGPPAQKPSEGVVRGVVRSDDDRPVPGVFVRLYSKRIGNEVELAKIRLGQKGDYELTYTREGETADPDLILRAYASPQAKKPLVSSAMVERARVAERIDLVVDRAIHAGQSLFDLVKAQVTDLQLDGQFEGLSMNDAILVAREAGLQMGVIRQFIQASALALGASAVIMKPVPAEPFFGLIRGGVPANPVAFATMRDPEMVRGLERALNENWINNLEAQAAVDAVRPLRVALLLQAGTGWIALFKSSGATEAQIKKLAEAYLKSAKPLAGVIEEAMQDKLIPAKTGNRLLEAVELYALAGGNTELLDGLIKDLGVQRPRDLVAMSFKQWQEVVRKHVKELPDWVEGETRANKVNAFARSLQDLVERMFPTPFFVQRWSEDKELRVPSAQKWLGENPEFEFNNAVLEEFPGGRDVDDALLRTERLFRIAPDTGRFPAFRALWSVGIQRSRDILNRGEGWFTEEMAGQGISKPVAHLIFARAQRVTSNNLLPLQTVAVRLPDEEATNSQVTRVEPTIAALFGDKGGNGCDHCVSAFSPSAYLVDLLRFLERANTQPDRSGKSGLELLFSRRPDIQNLRLDCSNSHTPMPYIDLVNELLEHLVATSDVPFKVPSDWMVESSLNLQTEWSAEELAAHPEHLSVEAYNRLRNPLLAAPWNLPYNLWADEVRTYLAQIGVDRTRLMLTLRTDRGPFKVLELATERLGIDASDMPALSVPANTAAKRLLVWQVGDPASALKPLRLFLRRTGLSYEESDRVFSTQFVNPGPNQRSILPMDLSDLEAAELDVAPDDNDGLLDRFHRFTRLWRKTGWSTLELDAVLQNVLPGDLNAEGIGLVGMVAELRERFGTPVEELAAWFGPLNTTGNGSDDALYQRSFLDGSVIGVARDGALELLQDVFRIVGDGPARELALVRSGGAEKWLAESTPEGWMLHPDFSPVVLAGCRIGSSDLIVMLEQQPSLFTVRQRRVALNLKHVSQVFRVASIARALNIPVEDLLHWQRLAGVSLGPELGPLGTLLVLEGIQRQLDIGVSAHQLLYALRGEDVAGLAPDTAAMDNRMSQVRADLLKAEDLVRQDVLTPADQLRLWISLDPASTSSPSGEEIDIQLGILDGTIPPVAGSNQALAFLEPSTTDLLFGDTPKTNADERLLLAAQDIPVGIATAQDVGALLEQHLEDEDRAVEILRLLVSAELGVGNASDIRLSLSESLPDLEHDYVGAATLSQARQRYLDRWVRGPLVQEHLAGFTGLQVEQVNALLPFVAPSSSHLLNQIFDSRFLDEDEQHLGNVRQALLHLDRQAVLVTAAGIGANFIAFVFDRGNTVGLFDLRTVGSGDLETWHATTTLFEINRRTAGETDLLTVIGEALDGVADEKATIANLATLLEVLESDLSTLVSAGALDMAFPDDYSDVRLLERLVDAGDFLRTCRLEASQVVKLTEPIINSEHANLAKAAVRANYEAATWREVSTSLREGLRERQRDSLLSFVRTRGGWDLSHEQAYAYYLIDVDMGACFETSRTKQAIASVQQFIQRIMLGLESEDLAGQVPLVFYEDDSREWVWRKNYRVWEANLKVFAFPENWLEPELRDEKSPFFESLEQELMQGELDNELAETAVTHYLEKLHDVGNLEIVGTYDDEDSSQLFVIGRTNNLPHQYYLRTWKNREIWSPWGRIDIEIEGDHVVPVVHNNRLHIYWGIFTEQVDEEQTNTTMQDYELDRLKSERLDLLNLWNEIWDKKDQFFQATTGLTWGEIYLPGILKKISGKEVDQADWEDINEADVEINGGLNEAINELLAEKEQILNQAKYQEIALNWIVQESGGWSGIKTSKGALAGKTGHDLGETTPRLPDAYWFGVSFSGTGAMYVNVYSSSLSIPRHHHFYTREGHSDVGYFSMDDCTGELVAVAGLAKANRGSELFAQSVLVYTRHVVATKTDFDLQSSDRFLRINDWYGATFAEVFSSLNDEYVYATTPHQDLNSADPFFLADSRRTFFAISQPGTNHSDVRLEKPREEVRIVETSSEPKEFGWRRGKTVTVAKSEEPSMAGGNDLPIFKAEPVPWNELPANVLDSPKLHFSAHYHPFTCAFLRQIRRYGIAGLYVPDPKNQPGTDATDLLRQLTLPQRFDFDRAYSPNRDLVTGDPKEVIDFGWDTAYGPYNWEVFFHIPMLIATRLTQQQRYEEAQKWFHYIFDPTAYAKGNLANFWKIKPFYYAQLWGASRLDLDQQLEVMEQLDASSLETMIETWESNPFQPHAIARFRPIAYMRMTVMKYLDNLVAWGDSLFRRDTMESLNEATQLYVLAKMILGERPLVLEEGGDPRLSFTTQEYLDGEALRRLAESQKPSTGTAGAVDGAQGILGVLEQFCLSFNERMLSYWDTVDDRLFKVRHCLNIDGVFRKLPLFQPPIDPALLVKAAGAGVDLSAVLSNLAAPRPHYRFAYMVQKGSELAGLAQGLGSQLLAALEKQDAEELAQLRADHEVTLTTLAKEARSLAVNEAEKNLEALVEGSQTVAVRRNFYQQRQRVSKGERSEDTLRTTASGLRIASQAVTAIAGPTVLYPDVSVGAAGAMGSPLTFSLVAGGGKASGALHAAAAVLAAGASGVDIAATLTGTSASRNRRAEEWDHQVELAEGELKQFEKQIAAAEIRIAMAEKDLANQQVQIEQSKEAEAFLKDKFTNRQLYSWMVTQLSTLYFQTYQLAYDLAKRAERCYQHELGIPDSQFIQFGYWESTKKGLLAGERLQLDLKRMDSSYLEHNHRELELSKTFSLLAVDPEALLRLKETGECFVSIPEALFDLDYPGHYFRRIKNVRLTLPAITGPYTTVSCTLTLLSDKYRKEAALGDDESLFEWNVGTIQSIATSSGQNDGGLFQLDFRDERYLPFERAGAISSWKLSLPDPDLAQFDYTTISDVLLHVDYTAREGGQTYRTEVEGRLVETLNSMLGENTGLPQLLSVKNHFPDQWVAYQRAEGDTHLLELPLSVQHLPYYLKRRTGALKTVKVILFKDDGSEMDFTGNALSINGSDPQPLALDPAIQQASTTFSGPMPVGPVSLEVGGDLIAHAGEVADVVLIGMLEVGVSSQGG